MTKTVKRKILIRRKRKKNHFHREQTRRGKQATRSCLFENHFHAFKQRHQPNAITTKPNTYLVFLFRTHQERPSTLSTQDFQCEKEHIKPLPLKNAADSSPIVTFRGNVGDANL
ncbi:hypothetical protein J1N35_015772 [Gossypium stocksii]|uniref:Uncharacterized protein n=1 Tax=Gossypium stocksii TaxID=47602 RepID=A0A9D3VZ18_9ROSI|nr:hypothetical protein J1N35_015772 [Gossypium stocksii]